MAWRDKAAIACLLGFLAVSCDLFPPIPPLPTPGPQPTVGPGTPIPTVQPTRMPTRPPEATRTPVVEPTPTQGPIVEPTQGPPPAISNLIGYSLPNSWQLQDPAAFAKLLGENHHSVTQMDWTPYIDSPNVCDDKRRSSMLASPDPEVSRLGALRSTNATYAERARALVTELRRWNVKAFINIANMNGCATTSRPDSWFNEQLNWIMQNIGTEGVVLYPVSEPWGFEPNGKSRRWSQMARNVWTGLFNLPDYGANTYTGRPYWNFPYDTLDVHYCDRVKLNTGISKGDWRSIANTDCSPILNPGAETAAQWAKQALKNNTNLIIYDFSARTPDQNTIVAMGRELGAAVPTPGPPQPTPTAPPNATPTPGVPGAPTIDQITFLDDGGVGNWRQTSTITSTSIQNPNVVGKDQYGTACINHTMAGKWPIAGGPDGKVEGNPWFVAKVNGQWYASTYEWNGPGQTCKAIAFGIWGKYSQYSVVQAWHPAPGELIGLFASTPARPGVPHSGGERSDIKYFNWPSATQKVAPSAQHKAGPWRRP
jgi:hypothetical protein